VVDFAAETEVIFMEDCAFVAGFSAAVVAVVAAGTAAAEDFPPVAARGLGVGGRIDFIAFIVHETREAVLSVVFIVDNNNKDLEWSGTEVVANQSRGN